jgi:nitroreductase
MENLAATNIPIHDLLAQRWSPRAFSPRPLEPGMLHAILEAARWAPSSVNAQPWAYVVARREDAKAFARMLSVLAGPNQEWAQHAAVLLLSVAQVINPKTEKPNRFAFHDVGQANAMLVLQATALGLASHQMGGFNVEAARERFSIPAGWEPADVIAVGYPGSADSLSETMREREMAPRSRKPLAEFVFDANWGKAAALPNSTESPKS